MDLFLLALFGCILEALVTRFGGIMIGTPTITISFLIVLIAVIRWNLWGLIIIPLLTLATVLGGSWSDIGQFRAFYSFGGQFNCGFAVYISTMIGLATIGLNVILFKRFGTKKIVSNVLLLVAIIAINYLIVNTCQFIAFRLITAKTLANPANLEYVGNTGKSFNIATYGENGFLANLFGLAVAEVGIIILRSQGVTTNVVDKLVEDKANAELDLKDRNFRIEEVEEKENENESSEEKTNEAIDESKPSDSSERQN